MSQQYPRARDKSGYLAEDTIAAISSAVGGAIAIVRLSGPRARAVLAALTGNERDPEPRRLARARLRSPGGGELDDAMAVFFAAPDTYTGEDLVEFHVHGGAFVAGRVMETLAELGARPALPGEFSFRAVRNGKMTLNQAQAVSDLIAASNDGAVQLALEKMSGSQNAMIARIAGSLRELAVLGEAGIDFSDQDLDEVSLPRLKQRLRPVLDDLEALERSYRRGLLLQEGVRVAFVGLPNAGKSSFFNALLGEDRSIVSEIAGTTRDVIREKITLRGKHSTFTLRLEDTAGLRAARNPIEKMGIERSLQTARDADLILFIVDPTGDTNAARSQWMEIQRSASAPAHEKTLGIVTKCDLVEPARVSGLIESLSDLGIPKWIPSSALTGAGMDAAVEAITSFCARRVHRGKGEVLLTRLDQQHAVTRALEHLRRAEQVPGLDLYAADIRQALHALGPLIGETLPDDILGRIFSDFCIGK